MLTHWIINVMCSVGQAIFLNGDHGYTSGQVSLMTGTRK
jgi:hypothetical protein